MNIWKYKKKRKWIPWFWLLALVRNSMTALCFNKISVTYTNLCYKSAVRQVQRPWRILLYSFIMQDRVIVQAILEANGFRKTRNELRMWFGYGPVTKSQSCLLWQHDSMSNSRIVVLTSENFLFVLFFFYLSHGFGSEIWIARIKLWGKLSKGYTFHRLSGNIFCWQYSGLIIV